MRTEQDAMKLVRAELCERLERLRAMPSRLPADAFVENVGSLRRLAAAYGLTPVERLASALEQNLFEVPGARGGPVALYLQRLGDAIGCERLDESASQAMVASVAVRLGV